MNKSLIFLIIISIILNPLSQLPGLAAETKKGQDQTHPLKKICNFKRTLRIGSKGEDVKCLQRFLESLSIYKYPEGPTGYYGEITEKAVREWQRRFKIYPASGVFGPKSVKKYLEIINQLLSKSPPVATSTLTTTTNEKIVLKIPEIKDSDIKISENGIKEPSDYLAKYFSLGFNITGEDPNKIIKLFSSTTTLEGITLQPHFLIENILSNENIDLKELDLKMDFASTYYINESEALKKLEVHPNLKEVHKKLIITNLLTLSLISKYKSYRKKLITKDELTQALREYRDFISKTENEIIPILLGIKKGSVIKNSENKIARNIYNFLKKMFSFTYASNKNGYTELAQERHNGDGFPPFPPPEEPPCYTYPLEVVNSIINSLNISNDRKAQLRNIAQTNQPHACDLIDLIERVEALDPRYVDNSTKEFLKDYIFEDEITARQYIQYYERYVNYQRCLDSGNCREREESRQGRELGRRINGEVGEIVRNITGAATDEAFKRILEMFLKPFGGRIILTEPFCFCMYLPLPFLMGPLLTIGPPKEGTFFLSLLVIMSPFFYKYRSLKPGSWVLGNAFKRIEAPCYQIVWSIPPSCVEYPIHPRNPFVFMMGTSLF